MGNQNAAPQPAPMPPPAAEPPVSAEVRTVQRLRHKLDDLEKRQEQLAKKSNAELALAKKKLQEGNKKGAAAHLRRKKMYEKEVENIENMRTTLENQVSAIESGATMSDVVTAMKEGAEIQKKQMKELDVDKVGELQDDIADMIRQGDEIGNVFKNSTDPLMDAEVEEELDALNDELAETELESPKIAKSKKAAPIPAPVVAEPKFPDVPSHAPKMVPKVPNHVPVLSATATSNSKAVRQPVAAAAQGEEEDEDEAALRELEAQMAN